MKKVAIALSIIALIVSGYSLIKEKTDYVTSGQFKEAKIVIDSIKSQLNDVEFKIDTLTTDINNIQNDIDNLSTDNDTMKSDLDLLKKGQEVIYNQVQKSGLNFSDYFKKYRK